MCYADKVWAGHVNCLVKLFPFVLMTSLLARFMSDVIPPGIEFVSFCGQEGQACCIISGGYSIHGFQHSLLYMNAHQSASLPFFCVSRPPRCLLGIVLYV